MFYIVYAYLSIRLEYLCKFKTAEIIDIICTTSSRTLQQVCAQDDRIEVEHYNFLRILASVHYTFLSYGFTGDSCMTVVLFCTAES